MPDLQHFNKKCYFLTSWDHLRVAVVETGKTGKQIRKARRKMKMTPSKAEECLILPLSGFITTKYLRKKINEKERNYKKETFRW